MADLCELLVFSPLNDFFTSFILPESPVVFFTNLQIANFDCVLYRGSQMCDTIKYQSVCLGAEETGSHDTISVPNSVRAKQKSTPRLAENCMAEGEKSPCFLIKTTQPSPVWPH